MMYFNLELLVGIIFFCLFVGFLHFIYHEWRRKQINKVFKNDPYTRAEYFDALENNGHLTKTNKK